MRKPAKYDMVWYGTVDHGWLNEKTGEKIAFKERSNHTEVWMYQSQRQKKGQRIISEETTEKAILQAKEVARNYTEKRYFDRNTC